MIAGIPLAFAEPLVLLGLLSLPILWWLLRLVPPRPRRIDFPPTRILFDIIPREETPARTPWWLTLLRLTLAALVIIAAAGPLWNPPVATRTSSAPIALLIDDDFAAAGTWDARMRTAEDIIARAEADNRGIAVVPLSVTARDISLETPAGARSRLRLVQPKPHAVERAEIMPAIERFLTATPDVEIVWLSDGVDAGHAADFIAALARAADRRPVTVVDGGLRPAHALTGADNAAGVLSVKVLRAAADGGEPGAVRAFDLRGLPLGEAGFAFRQGEREADAQLDLPVEIRNDIARIEIADEHSAGAVQLLDKRWRRRTVGVITGATADTAQPLLASTFYLSKALGPFADVRLADRGSPSEMVSQFVEQRLPMIILADVGTLASDAHDRLTRWIDDGGVLVRFAGPRLAAADDDLVPVRLRRGGRILGGSLSWDQPQQLAAFSHDGPFNGMLVPNDVTVNRQVLAEPDSGLSEHTWAMLGDGTPLVTAGRKGKGMMVLFHVTADTKWSDLPLSGAFVDMLKHIVGLSGAMGSTEANAATGTQGGAARDAVPPTRLLDGFGAFGPPPPTAKPVPAGYLGRATADNPPGFYGPPEGLVAVNTLAPADRLLPIDFRPLDPRLEYYRTTEPQDLRGPIFLAALTLLLIDALVVFWLAGGLQRLFPRRGLAGLLIAGGAALALAASLGAARAADPTADSFAARSTVETHLAYVVTGDNEADSVSKSGLGGLTTFLAQRTALEAGEPVGVDIERDELAFFPIIYWPVVPGARKPSPQALARVDAYMKQGGTVLFDTRDAVLAPPGPGGEARSPGMVELRGILSSLDIPELEPVPRDHVLTKTFFLLRDFPGRFTTGQLWVEALQSSKDEDDEEANKRPARGGDGVSSIIITSNDLAGAWATRPDGQAMLPLVPGEPRQREFAFRAGVNIVMYTLTGNYKADQVHVPALLERLGQ
jgi:Domain of unknown function (DUF4159)/Aerotolerance regulator N-terminal